MHAFPAGVVAKSGYLAMDSARRKHDPAWFRIIMLCATAFSIDFAFSVETAYGVPAILKTGLDEKYAPVLYAIGPVLGILFQGCLGSASDRCKCSWGRRRPFILGLAIVVCICVGLFPYGELLSGRVFHLVGNAHRAFVIGFTAITFVGMDFSLNMLSMPVRAYLLDSVTSPKSERGNSIYASMINIGATVGAVISCIPWKKLGLEGDDILAVQVKVLFGITVAVVVIAQVLTLCSVKERRDITDHNNLSAGTEESCSANKLDGRDNQTSTDTKDLALVSAEVSNNGTENQFCEASSGDEPRSEENVEQHDFEVSGEENLLVEELSNERGSFETRCNCLCSKRSSCFKDIVGSIYGTLLFVKYTSFTFLQLCILVSLSWLAYGAMNGLFTTFVGEVVYGGSPTSNNKKLRDTFDEGVIVGSIALVVQSFVALVYSLASEWITRCFGLRPVVVGVHLAYLVTCGVTVLYPTLVTAIMVNVVSGVYFALLVNFPFALISYYKVSSLYSEVFNFTLFHSQTLGYKCKRLAACHLTHVLLGCVFLGVQLGYQLELNAGSSNLFTLHVTRMQLIVLNFC